MWTRPPAKRAARAATPSEEIERMDPSNPIADYTAFFIQVIGSLLFGIVFLFLWRQSRAVYFGLWAAAGGRPRCRGTESVLRGNRRGPHGNGPRAGGPGLSGRGLRPRLAGRPATGRSPRRPQRGEASPRGVRSAGSPR